MSVLIEGMKMPKNCIECVAQFGGICFVAPAEVDDTHVAPTVDEAYEKGKPEWCPLKEAEPERKTGKWIFQRNYTWACSECGTNPTIGMGYVQRKEELFKYCPNCGAKMEKDE